MPRIGLLTSGGDCQALNATMRGIVKTMINNAHEPVEIYGFKDGYQGLIYGRYDLMKPSDFSGILTRGAPFWAPAARRSSAWTPRRRTASRRSPPW